MYEYLSHIYNSIVMVIAYKPVVKSSLPLLYETLQLVWDIVVLKYKLCILHCCVYLIIVLKSYPWNQFVSAVYRLSYNQPMCVRFQCNLRRIVLVGIDLIFVLDTVCRRNCLLNHRPAANPNEIMAL